VQGDVPRLLWKTADLVTLGPGPVVIGSYLYCLYFGIPAIGINPQTSLRCLDLETGRLMCEERLGSSRQYKSFSLIAANGILIVLDDEGMLYTAEASPDGFKPIAHCDVLQGAAKPRLFWTTPVLCNEKIYCRNFDGDLVCIDVSN
jgi:outer membrane protein assembly factor BamB